MSKVDGVLDTDDIYNMKAMKIKVNNDDNKIVYIKKFGVALPNGRYEEKYGLYINKDYIIPYAVRDTIQELLNHYTLAGVKIEILENELEEK